MHYSEDRIDRINNEGLYTEQTADFVPGTGSSNNNNQSNNVQKVTVCLAGLMFGMLVVLIGVISATYDMVRKPITIYNPATTVVTNALGLPGFENLAWPDVVNKSYGGTVNFYTCGGCAKYNKWIDNYAIPQLNTLYNIKMNRVPLVSTTDAVNKVQNEITKNTGMNNGSVDIIWLNLENFALLKNAAA